MTSGVPAHVWILSWADQQLERAIENQDWTSVVMLAGVLPAAVGYGFSWLLCEALAHLGLLYPVFALEDRTGVDAFDILGLLPFAVRSLED